MKNYNYIKIISLMACSLLIGIMLCCATSCENNKHDAMSEQQEPTVSLGDGDTSFIFTVITLEGEVKCFEINTNKVTVGDALLDVGIISGENTDLGLFVKTVDGETLDFEKDGKYWAFYIDGEYALTAVDSTKIDTSSVYYFIAE